MPTWRIGFAGRFAELLGEQTGRTVLLVPCAAGETGFAVNDGQTWDPGDTSGAVNRYHFAEGQIRAALATHPRNELGPVLFHMGETDVRHETPGDEFAERLTTLIGRLRDAVGSSPFLIGQMSPDRMATGPAHYAEIDAALRQVARTVIDCEFVEAPTASSNGPNDEIHFSAVGAREFAARYFAAYRGSLATR